MNIIDCKKIRQEMLDEAKLKVKEIKDSTGDELKLVVIQVEGDPASDVYIRNKIKTCKEVGIECEHIVLPNNISYYELLKVIVDKCSYLYNTGVMLQLPLPDHLKPYERKLLDLILWYKDVDGLSTESVGRLWTGQYCIAPATAQGVMRLLPDSLSGTEVCVVGRSNLVGKPLVKLLEGRNATVILCHSRTLGLHYMTAGADVVITAIGKPKFFDRRYTVGDRQMWIDVGINRDENGKLCGDVDIDSFKNTECSITPVPGGVGQLTTAQLALNVVKAYYLQNA